ncbi:hypothetical protein CAEBREN_08150 [Caenorhabditis brenneri]|uniref:Uncharacterized protein n=1 Tax=Caenorhabditis brenneri TaxID=135651 RepID=G0N286_CAEBE|nr:hypothetical protein CAEBREN_08150 [Caenorhabditis brenneri]
MAFWNQKDVILYSKQVNVDRWSRPKKLITDRRVLMEESQGEDKDTIRGSLRGETTSWILTEEKQRETIICDIFRLWNSQKD